VDALPERLGRECREPSVRGQVVDTNDASRARGLEAWTVADAVLRAVELQHGVGGRRRDGDEVDLEHRHTDRGTSGHRGARQIDDSLQQAVGRLLSEQQRRQLDQRIMKFFRAEHAASRHWW
jgi:hypothetical protein